MKDRELLIELYEIYNKLLTEKQRNYFELYYYEDLSLNEISENLNVSKSFVGKIINLVEKKLCKFENILKVNEKNKIIEKLHNN
jgi:RNA polymerase sigma factor (sigma-70 family)